MVRGQEGVQPDVGLRQLLRGISRVPACQKFLFLKNLCPFRKGIFECFPSLNKAF